MRYHLTPVKMAQINAGKRVVKREPSYTFCGNVNRCTHHRGQYAMLCYAKSLQSCPTLCDPIDGSLPGSPIPGILQARTLEWVAISFPNASKWKVKVKSLSCVRLLETLWTAAYQAPPSMGFSRQEYWSGVSLPSLECKDKFLEIEMLGPRASYSNFNRHC